MDAESRNISQDHLNGSFISDDNAEIATPCILCERIIFPDYETTEDPDAVGICGDCKFLLFENFEPPPGQDSRRRRSSRGRRTRYRSSSSGDLFSQQFSSLINLVRQNQVAEQGVENQPVHADARSPHPGDFRATANGSRRWVAVGSDTESDVVDNMDSLYAESESNASFGGGYMFSQSESDAMSMRAFGGGYMLSQSESDAMSMRAFGGGYMLSHSESEAMSISSFCGESNISVEGHSLLNSDTDIDPMNAGLLHQWNSDEEDEDEDGREEVDAVDIAEANGGVLTLPTPRHGDYLDTTRFEELLEHIAESESSLRGAPPAALSYVNSLPRVFVSEEHDKHGDLTCAICKDVLSVGTEASRLPCSHFYHPSCILPWLSARNSCPLCRRELPTEDREYEERRRNTAGGTGMMDTRERDRQDGNESSGSDEMEAYEARPSGTMAEMEARPSVNRSGRDGGGGSWFSLAAAPILSLIGIVLLLWLGNPPPEGRRRIVYSLGLDQQIQNSDRCPPDQGESRRRRWWRWSSF